MEFHENCFDQNVDNDEGNLRKSNKNTHTLKHEGNG